MDCAKVYGHAQVKAGIEEDAIRRFITVRRWRNMPLWKVIVFKTSCLDWRKCRGTWRTDSADEHVVIQGESRITGAVIIENMWS